MKQKIQFIAVIILLFNTAWAQKNISEIPIHHVQPPVYRVCGAVESSAYIDSALLARYMNWNLQSDSLPEKINPVKKGHTLEIWYVVSKEGKISAAKSPGNESDALANFLIKIFMNLPYQWLPAYRNGSPVNSFLKMRVVF